MEEIKQKKYFRFLDSLQGDLNIKLQCFKHAFVSQVFSTYFFLILYFVTVFIIYSPLLF